MKFLILLLSFISFNAFATSQNDVQEITIECIIPGHGFGCRAQSVEIDLDQYADFVIVHNKTTGNSLNIGSDTQVRITADRSETSANKKLLFVKEGLNILEFQTIDIHSPSQDQMVKKQIFVKIDWDY